MKMKTVALLHPGNMGVTIGGAAVTGGARVIWASHERSKATQERAREAGLVDVVVHADDIGVVPPVTERRVVPDPVLQNRSAARSVDVPLAVDRAGRAQAGRLQLRRVVAALQLVAGERRVGVELECVAAGARHDVHRRPAHLGFPETARRRHRHFR